MEPVRVPGLASFFSAFNSIGGAPTLFCDGCGQSLA
jgi:hypothetical protein